MPPILPAFAPRRGDSNIGAPQAAEVLIEHGLRWDSDESPRWRELRGFYLYVGIDLYADSSVSNARRLRHLLTHRRGAVETEADRTAYGSDYPFTYEAVELNEQRVLAVMDALAQSVRQVDVSAYEYSWGDKRVQELQAMRAAPPDDEDGEDDEGVAWGL